MHRKIQSCSSTAYKSCYVDFLEDRRFCEIFGMMETSFCSVIGMYLDVTILIQWPGDGDSCGDGILER